MQKLLLLVMLYSCSAFGQDSIYSKVYDYPGLNYEAFGIDLMSEDSGFVMAGRANGAHGLIVRCDSLGNQLWSKEFIGAGNVLVFLDVLATDDGGILTSGYSDHSAENVFQAFVTKLNNAGDTLWTRHLGLGGQNACRRSYITKSQDSTFLITWSNDQETRIFAAKLDQVGNLLWSNSYNGQQAEVYAIEQAEDSMIYLLGTQSGAAGFITKLKKTGELVWNKTIPTVRLNDLQILDDTLFIAGENGNHFLMKADTSGAVMQTTVYDSWLEWSEHAKQSLCFLDDSTIMMTSPSQSMLSMGALKRLNRDGSIIASLGVELSAAEVVAAPKTHMYIAGYGPLFGIKLLGEAQIGLIKNDTVFVNKTNCLYTWSEDTVLVNYQSSDLPLTMDQGGSIFMDIITLVTPDLDEDLGCVDALGELTESELDWYNVYPTITDGNFTIQCQSEGSFELILYGLSGELFHRKLLQGAEFSLDLSAFQNGMYIGRITDLDTGFMGKFKVVKD